MASPTLHSPHYRQPETVRRSANYHPSIWGDYFITNYSHDQKKIDAWTKRAQELKEEVKVLLKNTDDALQKMKLIDALQRLGVAYHFENDIERSLDEMNIPYNDVVGDDLYVVALRFRILRQQGYHVSSDVFSKFQDNEGTFKESLTADVEGLLCLYEAAHFSVRGEDILDHALTFTRTHLKSVISHLSSPLSMKVENALELPLRKCMPRVEARRYISVYQDDKERNDVILELAKLDFNVLMSLHQRELRDMSRWRNDMDLPRSLPFARDRLAECYFWILGVYYEPQYSRGRMIMTKVITLMSYMDDIYDVYGTFEELQLLNDAIQRWEIAAAQNLPEYAKAYFIALLKSCSQIEDVLTSEEKSYRISYLKEGIKALSEAYFVEVKWYDEGYVPSMEENLSNALISCGYPMLTVGALVGMGDIATKEAFDWMMSKPRIVMASSEINRLIDDIQSRKREQEIGQVATSLECYMKQHGISEGEAYEKFQEMIANAWKDITKEFLKPIPIDMPLLMIPLNFARVIQILYKDEDAYTDSTRKTKEYITSTLINYIPI